jgi:hypothetical protein
MKQNYAIIVPNKYWILYFLICFLGLQNIYAQTLSCGTPAPSAEQKELLRRLGVLKPSQNRVEATEGVATYFPVAVYILRKTDGTGGVSELAVMRGLAETNRQFANLDVQFYVCGGFNYVNDNTYSDFANTEEAALVAAGHFQAGKINVYYANTVNSSGKNVGGYAWLPGGPERIFIKNSQANDDKTVPHEFGHYFGLLHTFESSNNATISARELVTRGAGANCTTKGDDICDTPADPFEQTNGNILTSCVYTGGNVDANSEPYTPMTSNIMGYYFGCGNDFTSGQFARMQGFANGARNYSAATCSATIPAAPTLTSLTMVVTGVSVLWTDVANEIGYYIERSIDNINFASIGAVSADVTTFIDVSAASNTLYYYRVKPVNAPASLSNVLNITTSLVYCTPTYSVPCPNALIDDFIFTGVTNINNIDNNCSAGNYTFFNALSANVAKGGTYNFTVNFNTGGFGAFFPQNISIWVDTNNNGTFEVSERLFQSNLATNEISINGAITIPISSASGAIRMRVRSRHRAQGTVDDPCTNYTQGETEDYTLNISGGNDIDSRVTAPAAQVPSANINIGSVDANAFSFKITDLGTADAVPTNVTQVRIRQGAGNTVANWTGKITNAKLFDGATPITATPTITATEITFAITGTDLQILNNTNKDITLTITLGTAGFVENDKLAFQILGSAHGFIAANTGSSEFAVTFPAAVTGNVMNVIIPPQIGDIVINEFVTEAQQDWSSIGFSGTAPGGTGATNDEWIELFIKRAGMNLTGWTIDLDDATPWLDKDLTSGAGSAFQVSNYISATGGTFTNTKVGDYLVLGNVRGITSNTMNNTALTIRLKDPSGTVIDQVRVGIDATSAGGVAGSGSTGTADEAMARVPNGTKTGNDNNDFKKQTATMGKINTTDLIVTTSISRNGSYNNITIKSTGVLTLNGTINAEGNFVVESGGQLLTNFNIVEGTGNFTLQSDATLEIHDDNGITPTGATGTIRTTGTRIYDADATYIYKGSSRAIQQTGNGLPSQVLNLIIDARKEPGSTNMITGSGEVELTNPTVVKRWLELRNGNLISNGKLTLASNATQTAMVVQKTDGSNQVVGEALVERHITGGQAVYPAAYAGVGGYHYFSAPTAGATVAELDEVGLVLNPAYDFVTPYVGAFPNFYRYVEHRVQPTAPNDIFEKGWQSPANTSESLPISRGFIINITQGNTVDFYGNLNNGNLANINLTKGTSTHSGWHLMGNPYPAPISWTSLKALNPDTEIENSFLRRIPTGQYAGTWAYFTNGVGTNGGTDEIAMGQGFFVRAVQNNATYRMNNAARLTTFANPTFFRTENEEISKNGLIKLGISQGKFSDEAAVYFEEGAQASYDRYDAEKARFNSQPVPSIYTISEDNKNLAINGLPSFSNEFTIPLTLYNYERGAHTIRLNEINYFQKYVQVYLEDKALDMIHNLTQKPEYQFNMSSIGFQKDRFVVRFSDQVTESGELDFLTIFPNPSNGEAKLKMFSNYQGEVSISIYDITGRLHKALTINKNTNMFETDLDLRALINGIYILEIIDGNSKKIKKISRF